MISNNQLFDFGMAIDDISSYLHPEQHVKLHEIEDKASLYFKQDNDDNKFSFHDIMSTELKDVTDWGVTKGQRIKLNFTELIQN